MVADTVQEAGGRRRGESPVEIDHQIELGTRRGPDGRHQLHGGLGQGELVEAAFEVRRRDLERREAELLGVQHLVDLRARQVGPGVGADPIAQRTAEHAVHGQPGGLAGDVPQRHVDAADRGVEDRPAAKERAAIHLLPQVLDAGGVLPDKKRAEPLHHLRDGLVHLEQAALAGAVDAAVGFDPHEGPHPVESCSGSGRRAAVHGLYVGDSHGSGSRKPAPKPSAWSADYSESARAGAAMRGMSTESGRDKRRKKCPRPADPIMKSGL